MDVKVAISNFIHSTFRRNRSPVFNDAHEILSLLADSAGNSTNSSDSKIYELVTSSWRVGKSIDLTNFSYGPTHWKAKENFHAGPFPYYHFLAGVVHTQRCSRILEIGTHYGGSALSMRAGAIDPERVELITIDITDLNAALHDIPGVIKLCGDANSTEIIEKVVNNFQGEPIDLMYIDADHKLLPSLINISIYGMLLSPRIVIIDDISLNDDMRLLWMFLRSSHCLHAINVCDVEPEVRSQGCGFGLMMMREGYL